MDVLGAGNVEETLRDYADDAVIITPDDFVRGPAALRRFFENSVANVLPPGSSIEVHQKVVAGEIAYIVWSAESVYYMIPLGTDTFIIRDGLIVGQTFTGILNKRGGRAG